MSKIQLKDICCFSKGSQINGDELIDNGEYDYLNGGINPSGKWSDFNVSGDTITISEGGNSCGYVNYMPAPFWCGAHCYYLYDLKCEVKYLYYALKSQQDRIMKLRSGACMPNIKKSDIGCFAFEYTDDTSIQSIVVSNLDKVTRTIDICNAILEKLDLLVKSRFVEMFGEPSENPMGWESTTIGKSCHYIKDGPHKSLPDVGEGNGYPFISVRNIVNGYIDFSTAKYISEKDYIDSIKKCHPEKGDMLYSKGGTTGIAKFIDVDTKFANWVHVAVLKFDETLNGVFFEHMLNSDYCYEQSQRLTKGIANRDLVLSAMAQIKMYKPPLALQKQFATFVEVTDKSKLAVKQVLEKAETLKRALMQEYFG